MIHLNPILDRDIHIVHHPYYIPLFFLNYDLIGGTYLRLSRYYTPVPMHGASTGMIRRHIDKIHTPFNPALCSDMWDRIATGLAYPD